MKELKDISLQFRISLICGSESHDLRGSACQIHYNKYSGNNSLKHKLQKFQQALNLHVLFTAKDPVWNRPGQLVICEISIPKYKKNSMSEELLEPD